MDYESVSAPLASWPANHRAALVVIIHVDAPNPDAPVPASSIGLDYAVTGLQRLLKLLADLDLPATTAWTNRALASYPQIARTAVDQGHELALSRVATSPGTNDESMLGRITDIPLQGVVDALTFPSGQAALAGGTTAAALQSLSWKVTGVGGDMPISTLDGAGGGTIVIPVSPYWIDTAWLSPDRPLPPSSFLEAWSLGLGAVRAEGGLMTIVLHPHISGRPGLAGQIERFLDEAIDSGDVWIANASQVAEWWRQQNAQ
jgi:peptidoglycan/xylan/chitin deacetylase (PgdA/CDA1 family)